jgi:hypothetical protein
MGWKIPENLERCPTCGKFVSSEEGYSDLPPGGVQSIHYLAGYCSKACADRKAPPAIYEGTPEMEAWEASR